MSSENLEYIGKYRVLTTLGQGAMGKVYKCLDEVIQREVAVKIIYESHRQGLMGEEMDKRFILEAQAAARCQHPNIVTLFDYGLAEVDGSPFIVMEYIEGVELKHYLSAQAGQLSVGQSLSIVSQILEALSYAHQHGVVHRDIKPTNIIIKSDQQVKVMDFGVARLDSSELTAAGHMIGTPSYMSPEGLKGLSVDARSDLYSTGQLFLELLSGSKLKIGEERVCRVAELLSTRFCQPNRRAPFETVLLKALHDDPDRRYQSAEQFIADLSELSNSVQNEIGLDDQSFSDITETIVRNRKMVGGDGSLSSIASTDEAHRLEVSVNMTRVIPSEMIASIENELATYIGPVAPVVVKRTLGKSKSVPELTKKLGTHISDEAERSAFIKFISKSGLRKAMMQSGATQSDGSKGDYVNRSISSSSSSSASTSSKMRTAQFSEKMLAHYSKKLAAFLGPIASRLVKKAALHAASEAELKERLARKISDVEERELFLKG